MPVEKSAGAVVFRKEQGNAYYLVLQYDENYWGFPKGIIEEGEELRKTTMREIEEETGIKDIEFVNGFREEIEYFFKKEGKTIFKTNIYFLAETKTGEIKLSSEHVGFKWLFYEQALNQLTFDNSKEVLKKANDFIIENKA